MKGLLLTEYNEAEQMELFKEDGRREGIIETLISLVKDGILSIKDAADQAGITETAFEQKMAAKETGTQIETTKLSGVLPEGFFQCLPTLAYRFERLDMNAYCSQSRITFPGRHGISLFYSPGFFLFIYIALLTGPDRGNMSLP